MYKMLKDIFKYRYLILSSIKVQFKTQFIRSKLGGLWMLLQPLSQVLIFAFILSSIMSAKLPGITNHYAYSLYLMSGILGWTLFSEIITRCLSIFIENANLIKKLSFPKITLPIIVAGVAIINNILLFATIIIIFGILGHWPGLSILWFPVVMIATAIFSLGLGLVCGILNVFIRDLGQIIPIILQILFWFTPIVYIVTIIPLKYRHWLLLNPLAHLINAYQNVLLYNRSPHWTGIGLIVLLGCFLLFLALFLFRRASPEMVDQL